MVGTIEQAKETFDGFEQVGIGVAHTNALRRGRSRLIAAS
jgi:hypothetical protein